MISERRKKSYLFLGLILLSLSIVFWHSRLNDVLPPQLGNGYLSQLPENSFADE